METWTQAQGNLSPGAANKRVRNGIIALATGLLITVLMHRFEVSHYWRLLVFIPFFFRGQRLLTRPVPHLRPHRLARSARK